MVKGVVFMEKQSVLAILSGFDNPYFGMKCCECFGQEGLYFSEGVEDDPPFSKVILFRNIQTVVEDRGYYIFVLARGWVHFVHGRENIYRVFAPESFFDRDESDNDRSSVSYSLNFRMERFEDARQYRDIFLCYEHCFAVGRNDFYFRCFESRVAFLDHSFALEQVTGYCFDGNWLLVEVGRNELFFLPLRSCDKISSKRLG